MKKTILVDLDGVLNEYKGNYDENFIPPAKEGAEEFLKKLASKFVIKIFTTRPPEKAGIWVKSNNFEQYIEEVTNKKEPAHLIIDDRCINFDGNYHNMLEKIENFNVWYK